jgi:RNA polymerase sigma factor for flagellar operon FliA
MYPARRTETDALVEQHTDLVKRIAHHLKGRLPASVQVDDLVQAGMVGLLEAIRSFEEGRGASFATFAGLRVRGAMLDEVRRQEWAPRSTFRELRRIGAAVRTVEMREGREASAKEIAAELGVDMPAYQRLLRKVTESRVLSLETVVGDEAGGAEAVPGGGDPYRAHVREDFAAALAQAVEGLPERERVVLSLYYEEELNLREVGEVLGVSESRVCQLHGQALIRLRSRLTEWEFTGPEDEEDTRMR